MKRFVSTLLALALAVGMGLPLAASATDVVNWDKEPAAWALEQMEDLADGGILGQGNYNPTGTMTRGRFCYL